MWDEEKQAWVNRWGRDGKNKEVEQAWITEVPLNAGGLPSFFFFFLPAREFNRQNFIDVDHDPRKIARDARKERIAKNLKQQTQNIARAAGNNPRQEKKQEIEKTLVAARISTASMGKFDKKLEGEKKVRGVKRKVRCILSSFPCATNSFKKSFTV